jgi:spoIIIJ-associated protein
MNERTTLEKIAPSVDEAIEGGLMELGLTREAVDIEVLDEGSRGLLGIGGRQARVRLTLKQPKTNSELVSTSATENHRNEMPSKVEETLAPETMEAGFRSLDDNLLFISRQTVVEILEKMKITARVEARYSEADEEGKRPVHIDIRGNDLGILIGRRAEILNAMQYVVNLIVSKQVEAWVQIVIDVEGYRARRERQLRQMAQRMADQAVRTGRRQVLEPMAAVERRIVHLELRNHPKVITQSIGEEPSRKVTIVPKP